MDKLEETRLVERLRNHARQSSEMSKMMAQAKSRRQGDGTCDDLYSWLSPGQTTEWHAADALEASMKREAVLREAITQALHCTPSIGREYVGLAGMTYRNVIQYDCGDPWVILRSALSQTQEGRS